MDRRLLFVGPLAAAAAVGLGFYAVLGRMKHGAFDPHDVPSPLVGQRPPDFALPALDGHQGFGSADLLADLAARRRPMLVNFFASWCVPCVIEHPELMALSHEGLAIWGIAYKDTPEAAARFIAQRGNPFQRIALDRPGQVAIDWGVYGVPESYLIDAGGIVRWRMAGPITAQIAAEQLRPLLRSLA